MKFELRIKPPVNEGELVEKSLSLDMSEKIFFKGSNLVVTWIWIKSHNTLWDITNIGFKTNWESIEPITENFEKVRIKLWFCVRPGPPSSTA